MQIVKIACMQIAKQARGSGATRTTVTTTTHRDLKHESERQYKYIQKIAWVHLAIAEEKTCLVTYERASRKKGNKILYMNFYRKSIYFDLTLLVDAA